MYCIFVLAMKALLRVLLCLKKTRLGFLLQYMGKINKIPTHDIALISVFLVCIQ